MSNLVYFPRRTEATDTEPAKLEATTKPDTQTVSRIKLFDNQLVLTKRTEYANGFWQYSIKTETGYERKSTKTADFEKAKQVAIERWHEVQWLQGRGMSAKPGTFAQAANSWIEAEKYRASHGGGKHTTIPVNNRIVSKYMIPYFGAMEMSKITALDIKSYHKDYLAKWHALPSKFGHKKPTSSSMHAHEALIVRIYNHAREQNIITEAEMLRIPMTTPVRTRRAGFTDQEIKILVDHLEARVNVHNHVLHQTIRQTLSYYCQFLILSGMRPGKEPLLVRFCDIEDRRTDRVPKVIIKVRDGKLGPRRVMCRPEIMTLIEKITALHDNPKDTDLIFLEDDDWKYDRYGKLFPGVLAELGFERDSTGLSRSLYSLRHYFITDCVRRGMSKDFIARNCGTSEVMIHKHYSHVTLEMMEDQLTK